jgi:hypothetical protein
MRITTQTGLTQSLADFSAFESEIFWVGSGARVGIEIVTDYESIPVTPPTMKILCSVSGSNFGYLKDAAGNDVVISLNAGVNIFSLFEANVQAIQFVGNDNGSAGELNSITIGTIGG